jgi:serine/threonine-protein kinase HipA
MTALDVFFHADKVGRLERLPGAKLRFAYEADWAENGHTPLSLSLPLRTDPYDDDECRPFFSGLLPEGEFLKAIARRFHVSAGNAFAVLAEIGGECAGAVSLASEGEDPPFLDAPPPEWLDEGKLEILLAELPERPLLATPGEEDEGVRLSLAGSQDKLPLLLEGSRLGITRGRPPSSHIIKVPLRMVEDMVANEAYCMALAASSDMAVAEAVPIAAGEQEGLLVRRYDRRTGGSGETVNRIHQEDFCQALGCSPGDKYQAHGGPAVADCAALLRSRSAAPGADVFSFLDGLILNLLIGNADAHSKNYSLLLEGGEAPRLAPLYDLVSTRAYGRRFDRKMAMKYGGEYRPERIRGRHLDRLAGDLALPPRSVRRRTVEMLERVAGAQETARTRLPVEWQTRPVIDNIDEVITEQRDVLRGALAEPA